MVIRASRKDEGPSVEMTPIIDMVFMLLIFFLVATTFHQVEREMQIALPEAQASGPISMSLREVIINVTAEGEIILGGQKISGEVLQSRIQEAVKANPEQKVTVRGDRRTAYAAIVRVLDICKGSGIQEPYLDTVVAQGE
mgnify:CR=1 FL=1